jgi:hypothetical protein
MNRERLKTSFKHKMGSSVIRAWSHGSQEHASIKRGDGMRMDANTSSHPAGAGKSFSWLQRTEREPGHSSIVPILKIYWIEFGLFHTPSRRGSKLTLHAHKLIVVQLVTKCITLNGSQSSLSCSYHWAVLWVILVHSTLLHPTTLRFALTVSSYLCPGCLKDVLFLLLPYLSSCVLFLIFLFNL